MATNFPSGSTPYDTFLEPSAPEDTSLSSGGADGRTHTTHHRDLGDAVEALQRNVALKAHNHSGGTGYFDTAKLVWTNTHQPDGAATYADTDTSASAIHHTIGPGAFQAAAGNHNHDYDTLPNRPFIRCTSTTRPASPTLGQWIWETDTNRARVWAQFSTSNTANVGINSTDDFERSSATNLGAALWEQTYTIAGLRGIMATPDSHTASWTDQGNNPGRCIARRIRSQDAVTLTDDQIITWQTGGTPIEYHLPWITTSASNDMYFRMSADRTSYVRVAFTFSEWGQGAVTMYGTKTGVSGEQRIGTLAADTRLTWTYWTCELVGNTLSVYCGAQFLGKIVDSNSVTNKGASYRGWGIGMSAGDHLVYGQTTPSNLASVTISDNTYYTGTAVWQLLPIGAMPACKLRQGSAQTIAATGTPVLWAVAEEDNFGFWNPAGDRTQIVIKESGLYQVEAAIQWNPDLVPDIATAAFWKDGDPTTLQQSQFMRGNLFTPGFSQTLYVSGKLRCAAGSALQVKASYNTSGVINGVISSFVNDTSKINSRVDIAYICA